MKLSEAMRKGIECSEPTTGIFIAIGNNGKCQACALGAAMLGFAECDVDSLLTYDGQNDITSFLTAEHILRGYGVDMEYTIHDDKNERYGLVGNLIIHLNDTRKLTREQIADWLETLNL